MSSYLKTYSTISLIFGIISLVIFCIPVFSLFIALAGFSLGIIAIVKTTKSSKYRKRAIAGTIISGIALLICVFWNIYFFDYVDNKKYNDFFNPDSGQTFDIPINDDVDTVFSNSDSLLLNENQLNELDNSMNDTSNGPGNAPE